LHQKSLIGNIKNFLDNLKNKGTFPMKFTSPNTQQGFTLIELMIVVAIIGILASIAVPSYQTYVKKAKFSEVVMATSPYKTAIELCAQTTLASSATAITGCIGGSNGIPADISTSNGNVASIATTTSGLITATAIGTSSTADKGLNGETYVMTPTITTGKVTWINSGTCVSSGLC
jgi:type IV pilus assembly protein PilA